MLSRKRIILATIAALVGLAACSSSEGADVAAETPTGTETDATPSADESAEQTDQQPRAESQGTGPQPPAQPESGSQGTGPQPPAPPDAPAPAPAPTPDATTTPLEPAPDTAATPPPEETTAPIRSATVTVNQGVIEASPECFSIETPELTYQSVEFDDRVLAGSSSAPPTENEHQVAPLTLSVDRRRTIIFSTPTVFSGSADLFYASVLVVGTLGDVTIDYREGRVWPDQPDPLPSREFFSRSNPACFVGISFNANMELEQPNLDPPTEVFEAPVSN